MPGVHLILFLCILRIHKCILIQVLRPWTFLYGTCLVWGGGWMKLFHRYLYRVYNFWWGEREGEGNKWPLLWIHFIMYSWNVFITGGRSGSEVRWEGTLRRGARTVRLLRSRRRTVLFINKVVQFVSECFCRQTFSVQNIMSQIGDYKLQIAIV